jgi:hypothetical protein
MRRKRELDLYNVLQQCCHLAAVKMEIPRGKDHVVSGKTNVLLFIVTSGGYTQINSTCSWGQIDVLQLVTSEFVLGT